MNQKKLAIYTLLSASIVLLLGGVEVILASHTASITYISPTSSGTGVTQWYYMGISNDAGSSHSINKVELPLASGWEAVDVDAPGGWSGTCDTANDKFTWETTSDYINPGGMIGGFDWRATAPNTGGGYTMTVTTTDTNGDTDTTQFTITVTVPEYPLGLAAVFASSLFMYIFLRKIQKAPDRIDNAG